MKELLCLGAGFLFFALAPSGSRESGSQARDRDRFIGAWRLAWLEEVGADGKVQRVNCTGMLVFTGDGHMSVQVMYRNTQTAPAAGPVQYAQGGYEASFGRYEVDERAHTFAFHVEGALVRSLVGQDLTRGYELSGTRLIVKPASPTEHWRVAWEKGCKNARLEKTILKSRLSGSAAGNELVLQSASRQEEMTSLLRAAV